MQNLKRNWLVQNWHGKCNKFWPKHLKISKICSLMGCFWPKYIMLQLREYREVMFHGTQDSLTNLKENWFVVSKITRIWWILIRALKSSKNLHFNMFFPVMFDLKRSSGVILHDTREWCKIWRETDLCFQKWHEEFEKVSPEHLKDSKFGLWDSFKSKVENVWASNLQGNYLPWQWKRCKTGKGIDLPFQNWDEDFDQF